MRSQMVSGRSRRPGRPGQLGGKGRGHAAKHALVALSLVLLFVSAWGVGGRSPEGRNLPVGPCSPTSSEAGSASRLDGDPWGDGWTGEGRTSPGDMLARADKTGSWESERPLVEEAQTILAGYRQRGDCVLARAGYVDLLGRAWSCVIQGDGWVDVCVVRETDEGGSRVSVSRMEASTWEGDLNVDGAQG